jgi:hypothetical protein
MNQTEQPLNEYNFMIVIGRPFKTNAPWLENRALVMEDALIHECAGEILGPSVTANFDENGWEVDLTIEAPDDGTADERFRKALEVIERVGEIELDRGERQVRSTYRSEGHEEDHRTAELVC